ncbi:MAG: hypothetical protein MJA83_00080 [Gammaproteobacteria bacterium]|nr:hypothetical protein [Gammaproteobacteria bacterium]
MKILTALVVVQTALIVFLLATITDSNENPDPLVFTDQHSATDQLAENPLSRSTPREVHYRLDEKRLRKIIREELAAQSNAGSARDTKAEPFQAYEAKHEVQREMVDQELEYFRSVGAISDMEMQDLQTEISKLTEADRREMLRKLIKAMNAGEIKGRL